MTKKNDCKCPKLIYAYRCKSCGTTLCESCANSTKMICPNCYDDLEIDNI
ncbi:MAG: hypothetical protein II988_03370 [Clostridia bacterium]|nr:hypothetical protein [Clostridia bacterium]